MNPPSWLKEILKFMGYGSDDWIVWDSKTAMINKLIIPKLSYVHSFDVDPNPLGKKWARQQALKSLESTDTRDVPE
jgi:hypothetical protein